MHCGPPSRAPKRVPESNLRSAGPIVSRASSARIAAIGLRPYHSPSRSGEEVLAREQRKLAAILFADAVGSSRLMGRDESGTVARLLDHMNGKLAPAVARRGGR